MIEGPPGTVWLATAGDGLHRLRGQDETHYTTEDGLPSNQALSLFRDEQGAIWIGTKDGGLARLIDGTITSINSEACRHSNRIHGIIEVRQG